jgi:signal transduction histidine kinase
MRRWRRARASFFWRVGGLLLALVLLGGAGCAGTLWILGIIGAPEASQSLAGWIPFAVGLLFLAVFLRGVTALALPLRDLIEAAGRVEAGDLTASVPERGPREFRMLARAFNAMTHRLEANESARQRLLADVTHELRTPVAVIQGNLEAMLEGVYPPDEPHLAPVLEETHMLSRLIDDLRTLSLAESGALELHREPTDLAVLAGEVIAAFRSQAEGKGVAIQLEVSDDLPIMDIDPLRVREILANLVANALRHTPQGGKVSLREELDEPRRRVFLSVVDTGEGIRPEDLPHIFDRFYKSHDSAGSGLGLAIAKNLVEAHGGEIVAESSPGKGTSIRFTVPIGSHSG